MKKPYAADEPGRFFLTGLIDATWKTSHFNCKMCCWDVFFPGCPSFPTGSRLETPGWRVIDLVGNLLFDEELERQKKKSFLTVFVKRDRENMFTEGLLVDQSSAADSTLPVLPRLSSLMQVMKGWQLGDCGKTLEPIFANCQPS